MRKNAFDAYVDEQMKSPQFEAAYGAARAEIDTIDQLVRALDVQREAKGLTKAKLAHDAGMKPAALRRLFTRDDPNPTFSTIATLVARLDLQLVVVPKTVSTKPARSRSKSGKAGATTRSKAARSSAKRPTLART